MREIFKFQDALPCQLTKHTDFQIPFVHSVFSSIESIKFLAPITWEILPREINHLEILNEFKKAIKQ